MTLRIVSKGYFESIRQFHIQNGSSLGVGSFGTVKLGIHLRTNKRYAIKIINLEHGMKESQLKILQRQILLHSSLDHPHIVKLWDTLQQGTNIYMVLDLATNGSLFHYQNIHTRFSQVDAYKFFYQTLDALKYLHSQNIMHRDIKPENLLLDNDFNIKVCDFGWATQNVNQKRSTFCGTYQYMAPQMAYERQYDYRIDIWALGVLLYELIHGYAPFKAKSLEEIKDKISKGAYEISNSCSKELKNLIMSVLQFDPDDRPNFQSIIKHQWVIKVPEIIVQTIASEKNDKKVVRKMSNQEIARFLSPNINNKHKKHQSTDFQSSLKQNFFLQSQYNKSNNSNLKKAEQQYKKALKKKCKTQGEENMEKIYQIDEKMCQQFNNKQSDNLKKQQLRQNYVCQQMQGVLRNEDIGSMFTTTAKMKKLEMKISELTNKYGSDKKKLKVHRNSKLLS